jgi:hypothetical protein
VTLDHIDPICFLFSSIHYGMHALIGLPKPYTFRIWIYTWLVMLSPAVMNVVQVLHIYGVEFRLCYY